MSICYAGDCVCNCVLVFLLAKLWEQGRKAAFLLGRSIRSFSGSGQWPATQAQRTPALEDRQGTPCQAWHLNNCLIEKLCAGIAAWPFQVELPSPDSLFSPLFHPFPLSFLGLLLFSLLLLPMLSPWEMCYLTWFPDD